MPFICDFEGNSPLHLSRDAENIQGMGIILGLLSKDPLGNHSRAISDVLPDVMLEGVAELDSYFNSRIMTTKSLSRLDRGKLKVIDWTDSSLVASQQWPNIDDVKKGLLDTDETATGHIMIKNDIVTKIIDIPDI